MVDFKKLRNRAVVWRVATAVYGHKQGRTSFYYFFSRDSAVARAESLRAEEGRWANASPVYMEDKP
jgi:hypothetical protein